MEFWQIISTFLDTYDVCMEIIIYFYRLNLPSQNNKIYVHPWTSTKIRHILVTCYYNATKPSLWISFEKILHKLILSEVVPSVLKYYSTHYCLLDMCSICCYITLSKLGSNFSRLVYMCTITTMLFFSST